MSARSLWTVLETLHCVTYFAPEARTANEAAGMRGFWRGYVGTRSAPLGEVGLGAVTAIFYNFAPSFLARSLPSIWSVVTPEQALAARTEGAVAALRAHLPDLAQHPRLPEMLAVLRRLVDGACWAGRPLGSANAALPWPGEPLAALWHATTALREHRGDGHFATLLVEGIDGVEANALRDAADGSRSLMAPIRGWTDDEWAAARDRLTARGLVAADGTLTGEGRRLREHIERRTDTLAESAYTAATDAELAHLEACLRPYAQRLVPAVVPDPSPVGNPRP